MSKHNEFLIKLKELMLGYNVEITAEYHESGCECCSGYYEFEIETRTTDGVKNSTISTSYLNAIDIQGEIKQ